MGRYTHTHKYTYVVYIWLVKSKGIFGWNEICTDVFINSCDRKISVSTNQNNSFSHTHDDISESTSVEPSFFFLPMPSHMFICQRGSHVKTTTPTCWKRCLSYLPKKKNNIEMKKWCKEKRGTEIVKITTKTKERGICTYCIYICYLFPTVKPRADPIEWPSKNSSVQKKKKKRRAKSRG